MIYLSPGQSAILLLLVLCIALVPPIVYLYRNRRPKEPVEEETGDYNWLTTMDRAQLGPSNPAAHTRTTHHQP